MARCSLFSRLPPSQRAARRLVAFGRAKMALIKARRDVHARPSPNSKWQQVFRKIFTNKSKPNIEFWLPALPFYAEFKSCTLLPNNAAICLGLRGRMEGIEFLALGGVKTRNTYIENPKFKREAWEEWFKWLFRRFHIHHILPILLQQIWALLFTGWPFFTSYLNSFLRIL